MKKYLSLLLLLALLFSLLCSCSAPESNGKISIVCTLFPQYDWIKNIVGNSSAVEVTLLIQNGTDPHSYQPTAADIMKISNCQMIVYSGAESDKWVQDALRRAHNENIVQVALSSVEGMVLHNISSASHSHGEHDHSHSHGSFDEHIWLSLGNAITAARHLTEKLCTLDSANASLYRTNAESYMARLSALDGKYRDTVAASAMEKPFMLFADRFPFVYLLEDYDIEYAAAFEGCTTDVDADFGTVLSLIKEADTHAVKYIAVTETSDGALASTVSASAKCKPQTIVMNSLQSVKPRELKEGISYISVMEENLRALSVAIEAKGE